MSPLQTVKYWLIQHFDLAKDALHIYVALLLFFGSALLFRWPVRSWKPWAIVLAAALIGEALMREDQPEARLLRLVAAARAQ